MNRHSEESSGSFMNSIKNGSILCWKGQKKKQRKLHSDGSHSGSASAVRNAERLVQVEVRDVGADGGRLAQRHLQRPTITIHSYR